MKTFYTLPIPAVNSPAGLFEKFFTKSARSRYVHDRDAASEPRDGTVSARQDVTAFGNLSVVGQTLRKFSLTRGERFVITIERRAIALSPVRARAGTQDAVILALTSPIETTGGL